MADYEITSSSVDEVGHDEDVVDSSRPPRAAVADSKPINGMRKAPNGYNKGVHPRNGTNVHCSSSQNYDRIEPVVDMVEINDVAHKLAMDIVEYFINKQSPPPPLCRHAETLRRTADIISEKHTILLSSMVKKLRLGEDNTSCANIVSVANEMFSDKHINWGRIVTLYTFGGWLARYCVENGSGEEWAKLIAETVSDYVTNHLTHWIVRQGGWDDMDDFFPEEENLEKKIFRGLMYTVLGLGALATTVAAVR